MTPPKLPTMPQDLSPRQEPSMTPERAMALLMDSVDRRDAESEVVTVQLSREVAGQLRLLAEAMGSDLGRLIDSYVRTCPGYLADQRAIRE